MTGKLTEQRVRIHLTWYRHVIRPALRYPEHRTDPVSRHWMRAPALTVRAGCCPAPPLCLGKCQTQASSGAKKVREGFAYESAISDGSAVRRLVLDRLLATESTELRR